MSVLNCFYKTLSVFRPFQNKRPMPENKRIMGRFAQPPVYQSNKPTIAASITEPTTPTRNIFSI